jgi:YidC/Oxa1 family membrane protein insertase
MVLNLFQVPMYMGMFFAIRYMSFSPEAFPNLHGTSFLYMDRIVEPDPYFLIPIMSAVFTFLAIKISKKRANNQNMAPLMVKMMNVMQYVPFGAVFILGTYPAVLNMYWCSVALMNLVITIAGNSEIFKKIAGTHMPFPGTMKYEEYQIQQNRAMGYKAKTTKKVGLRGLTLGDRSQHS